MTGYITAADMLHFIMEIINQNALDLKENLNQEKLKGILELYFNGLKRVNYLFSRTFLALISSSVVYLIIMTYNSIIALFEINKDFTSDGVVRCILLFMYPVCFIILIILINNKADTVMNKLDDLYEAMLQIDKDSKTRFQNEDGLSIIYDRNDVMGLLKHFKGFECGGYFILGKPLISSIFATFATYVVILTQFKISEYQ